MLFFYRPLLVSAFLYHSHTPGNDTSLSLTGSLKRRTKTAVDEYALCAPDEKAQAPISPYLQPSTPSPAYSFAHPPQREVILLRGHIIPKEELSSLINEILAHRQTALELQLSCNDLGDEGALALAGMLKYDRHVKTFRLAFNQVSGVGVKAVADALAGNDTLESLDLSSASIDTPAASALAAMLETNHALRSLTLELCTIGERELGILAEGLAKNSALNMLDIGLCNVKNSGLRTLIRALETNHTLETVILRGNQNLDSSLVRELNRLLTRNQYLNGMSNLEPDVFVSSRLCY